MPDKPSKIFISAGDPSGDIAGSHLIRELKNRYAGISIFGLGGQRMHADGQEQIIEGDRLAVLGFWEVARKYFFFRRLMLDTVHLIENKKPQVIILIDYPGFNLRLAQKIKSLNIPIVYYISPQIWAWAPKRINQIKELVNIMLLILPFEKDIYDGASVPNKFVGHYLLDDMNADYIKAPYNPDSDLITLMPGSRPQEIKRMLPVMLKSAELLSKSRNWRFAVAAVENNIDYDSYMEKSSVSVEIITGRSRQLIKDSRLVITSSGTATLETGIIGRPMVVIYKTGLLTYLIARQVVKINEIALINIASGRRIVPELIQYQATAANIAAAAARFLDDEALAIQTTEQLKMVTDELGGAGCSRRVADVIGEYISC